MSLSGTQEQVAKDAGKRITALMQHIPLDATMEATLIVENEVLANVPA